MTNKRNMTMETVAVLFLVSRSNVSHLRRCTSESNDNIYGIWRQILREFNMEQPISIVGKQRLNMKAVFEIDILTSRSNSVSKGYPETFPGFVSILKAAASTLSPYGPINVDPDIPEVIQIWSKVKKNHFKCQSVRQTTF